MLGSSSLMMCAYVLLPAGVKLAVACAPNGTRVHIYGFNWSDQAWKNHKVLGEELFTRHLQSKVRILAFCALVSA